MIALDGLERLESPALWRSGRDAQRREVYITVGEAELVIEDKTGTALSHWSLPALVRRGRTETSAIYVPAPDAGEELEVEEPEMIVALDRLIDAVEKGRRRPGALRRLSLGIAFGFALGLGALWLPGALRNHAAIVMPAAQRADIGSALLRNMTALTGPPCDNPTGVEALSQLRSRLFPTTPINLVVLRDLPPPALALPGGTIVLSDRILIGQDDPDVAAGHVLATALAARTDPPLERFLDRIGFFNMVQLFSSGRTPEPAIVAHAEALLLSPPSPASDPSLRSGFVAAQLAWGPYARATGLPVDGEAAPVALPPVLEDAPWQLLREICGQ